MSFPILQDPLWLLGLFAIPWLIWRRRRSRPATGIRVSKLPPGSAGLWRTRLPFALRLLALALLIVALARPQLGYGSVNSSTLGIDVEIALDISGSMGAEDFQPANRLTVAKQVVADFIRGRSSDRIGLVVFSGAALTRAPLTRDRNMLVRLVETVELNTLPDGTAIGVALAHATARLRHSAAESKVIVLVTDGVNNAGAIDPMTAAAVCRGLGVRVYTIGVGTAGRVPVPIATRSSESGELVERRVMLDVEVDETLLAKVAETTGGKFFQARDAESLRSVFEEINELEKTELEVKEYVRYEEIFQPLIWSALLLLLLPLLLSNFQITTDL